MNGGSFKRAEQMARDFIAQGRKEIYLDLALLYSAQGDVKSQAKALDDYARFFPDCPRLRHARAWRKLYDGDLQAGLDHIEAGRVLNCLGSTVTELAAIPAPQWDGKADLKGKTVLLYGEGGDGDHIMCVRAAQWLRDLGATVLVGCSQKLLGLFSRIPVVSAAVERQAARNVRCDFYVPAMSSFRLCGCKWETLWRGQYIQRPHGELWHRIIPKTPGKKNVALRWKGNPQFEHEQFRVFPPELMFQATDLPDLVRWSVQKDDRQTFIPPGVVDLEPLLGDWEQTAAALGWMDLVITSDTAVAHLAAAMNVPTWVLVPIMPYWPWARPGDKTAWYPSVRLFRQQKLGDWTATFEELRKALAGLCGGN